jgi:hypothetical protein
VVFPIYVRLSYDVALPWIIQLRLFAERVELNTASSIKQDITVLQNVHALLHGLFNCLLLILTANQALILYIRVLLSGCDTLYCVLNNQLFLQPQLLLHRDQSLSLYYNSGNQLSMTKISDLVSHKRIQYLYAEILTSGDIDTRIFPQISFVQHLPSVCFAVGTVCSLYACKPHVCAHYVELQIGKCSCLLCNWTCMRYVQTPHLSRMFLDAPNICSFLEPSIPLRNGVSVLLKLTAKTCNVFQLRKPQKASKFVSIRRHGDCAKWQKVEQARLWRQHMQNDSWDS